MVEGGANKARLNTVNDFPNLLGISLRIEILQATYLNNITELNHRFIKRLTRQMKGLESFSAASATLAGIELARAILKDQINATG